MLSNKDEFSASRFFNDDTTVTLARLNSARTDFEIYFCEKVKKKTHLFEMSCQFQKLQIYINIKYFFRVRFILQYHVHATQRLFDMGFLYVFSNQIVFTLVARFKVSNGCSDNVLVTLLLKGNAKRFEWKGENEYYFILTAYNNLF